MSNPFKSIVEKIKKETQQQKNNISNGIDRFSNRLDTPGMRDYCFNQGMGEIFKKTDMRPTNGGFSVAVCTMNRNLMQSYGDGYRYTHNK
jgi:hypothetical protein